MHASTQRALPLQRPLERPAPSRAFLPIVIFAVIYFAAGKLGLELASLHQSASPVWPATGIALAAVLLYGARVWPAIFAGAFLVNLTTAGTLLTSLGVATGNTLEALVGAWLVHRYAHGTRAFDRASDVLRFTLFGGLVAPIVSATVGVSSLAIGGFAEWDRVGPIWLTWWLGDAVGALLVAPLILVWARKPFRGWRHLAKLGEAVLAVAVVVLVAAIVFGGLLPAPFGGSTAAFLCFPALLWPVFRLGRRGTVTALFALCSVALAATLAGEGPFSLYDLNDSLLVMQAFVATITIMNLVLAALVGERQRALHELGRSQVTLESQLIEIEDLYRTAPVGLCLLDRDLRFVRINAWLAEINGISAGAHIGRTLREVVPDLANRAEPSMRRVLATGEAVLEHEIAGATAGQPGVTRHWLESYYPLLDADGGVRGLSVVVQEVTSMKRAEEAVRQSERELTDLFENASQGIDWVSTAGTILRANRAGLRMLGYGEDEYVGRHLADFHASPEVARMILRRVERGERVEEFPAQLRCKDGSLRDVVIDSNLYQRNGVPQHAQLFVRDVTERRQAEAELALSQQELEQRVLARTAELAQAKRRLQAEAEARKRLEAEVAAAVESEQLRLGQELHEGLGQELTGIAYLMAALHRALQGTSSQQAFEAMHLEDMITRSIERTRTLAKGFYPVEMETLGLYASLEEIAYNAMESFGIRCLVRADDPLIADLRGPLAIQLFRIAQEAVSNAVQHGQAGLVEISVTIDGDDLVMTVADDGIGMPGDLAEVEGAGLRIMRYRASIVGGMLEVRPRPSGGSMVLCSAPLPAS